MNRGVLQSSPVEQIMASGNPNWWSINNNSYPLPGPVAWSNNGSLDQVPEPWSQLLLVKTGHFEAKMLEDWEDQVAALDRHHQVVSNANNSVVDVKREGSPHSSYVSEEFNNMAGFFTTNTKADLKHPPPDRSSDKCSSNGNGGALKKARVHTSSNQMPSCKVRKEKLGDRVTVLHQLVSPFGKTDTASVLLEVMGYIRFLQNQIEALSLPYFGSGSSNMRQQHSVHGDGSCLFPQDPGQEHEQGPKRDLMSRGLCLVPVSCTLQVGSDNVIDYWAPALGGAFWYGGAPGRRRQHALYKR